MRRALLDEAVAFCETHGIPLYAVNENPENPYAEQYGVSTKPRKVYADSYIDDKAQTPFEILIIMHQIEEHMKEGGFVSPLEP